MPRLIDADKLLDTLGIDSLDCEKCSWGNFDYCKRGSDFADACSAIEDAPTVDAEPVVRCKDCKECEERHTANYLPFLYCKLNEHSVSHDAFCCWAERKEDGQTD